MSSIENGLDTLLIIRGPSTEGYYPIVIQSPSASASSSSSFPAFAAGKGVYGSP